MWELPRRRVGPELFPGTCGAENPRTLAPEALSQGKAPARAPWAGRPSLGSLLFPELPYEDVFAVWEVIWAARHISSEHFVLFIALALVEAYREIIRDNNMDFTDIIKFFNGRSCSAVLAAPAGVWGLRSWPALGRRGFQGHQPLSPLSQCHESRWKWAGGRPQSSCSSIPSDTRVFPRAGRASRCPGDTADRPGPRPQGADAHREQVRALWPGSNSPPEPGLRAPQGRCRGGTAKIAPHPQPTPPAQLCS